MCEKHFKKTGTDIIYQFLEKETCSHKEAFKTKTSFLKTNLSLENQGFL